MKKAPSNILNLSDSVIRFYTTIQACSSKDCFFNYINYVTEVRLGDLLKTLLYLIESKQTSDVFSRLSEEFLHISEINKKGLYVKP